jgi:hypothetical protein
LINWKPIQEIFSSRTVGAPKFKFERLVPRGSFVKLQEIIDKLNEKKNHNILTNQPTLKINQKRKKSNNIDSEKVELPILKKIKNQNTNCAKCARLMPGPQQIIAKIKAIIDDNIINKEDWEKTSSVISYIMNDCSHLNCLVRQQFGNQFEVGKIVGFNGTTYTALYDDGEYTQLNLAEVKRCLCCN